MNIWVQMWNFAAYLLAGVFVAVALGVFLWFKSLKNTA
jgi:hypothetical protein